MMGDRPASPCVGVCRLDVGVCLGCGRTIEDIAQWAAASTDRKLEIIRRAKQRKQYVNPLLAALAPTGYDTN